MKNNIIVLSLRNSVIVTLAVMLGVMLLYHFSDVSANEFRLTTGESLKTDTGFIVRFISGGIYSEVHEQYINDRVFGALLFSFSFTGFALFLTLIISVLIFQLFLHIPVRFFNSLKSIIVMLNFLPSYIIQIILVSMFCFMITAFPVSYIEGSWFSLLFPLLQLLFLFTVHTLFILIQNLTTQDIMNLNYRLNLHQFRLIKQIQFILLSEKRRIWFALQSLLPLVIAGHIYTELIFSLPGYSRLIFIAIREFDKNAVICLLGILTFLYSFIYFLSEPENG